MDDPLNAYCAHGRIVVEGSGRGPLLGLTFAVKDAFDVAGYRTGNGHPLWLETHPPAARTASTVQRLLDAGARLVGKTQMDELAYSLNGENFHYGTPKNPKAPGRIPGGSSSGSAAVVAGGLADFALGTDCGGSVRIPASYCGLYGIRTSHGRVATDGIVPFASSFDTVGWFTRDAPLLRQVGDMLLPDATPFRPKRLLVAADAFAAMDPEVREALDPACRRLTAAFAEVQDVSVYADESADVAAAFRVLQGSEIAANHGPWIDRHRPTFGPGVRERFLWTRTIDPADVAKASMQRERFMQRVEDLLNGDALLCLPTAPGIAPRLQTPPAELDAFRARAFALLAIAGLARLPQVNLPLGTLAGCPLGISLLAPHGGDRGLLDWWPRNSPEES